MSSLPEKVVAFLDLLGFSEVVNSDSLIAVRLLQDYADAITIAVKDAAVDASNIPINPEASRLMELMTVTSFETLLPMSDSIFIVASDTSKFVMQLSHFLLECFRFRLNAFAQPEHSNNPMEVTTRTVVRRGEDSSVEKQMETWWPVLFRGGISFGECLPLQLPIITDAKLGSCRGLIGKAIVEAVKLEKLAKGPRVLCSPKIQDNIQGAAAAYIGPSLHGEKDCVELYWPIALFEDTASMTDAINNHLREWLQGVANLYMHFRENDRVRVHYEAYLRLLVASAMRKYPAGEKELKQAIHALDPDLLQIAFFPKNAP
jgi:hypothetical protein